MCEKLLANPIIEDLKLRIEKDMKFGIVVFPGSNCDQDCLHIVKNVLKRPVEYIWHKDTELDGFEVFCDVCTLCGEKKVSI